MLGEGLPWEEDQFLSAVAIGVDVHHQLQSLVLEIAQTAVRDLDGLSLPRRYRNTRLPQHCRRPMSRLGRLRYRHHIRNPLIAESTPCMDS